MICTIRFAIKYHVGLSLFGRWGRLGKIGFILTKNGILQGLKLVGTYAIKNFIEISRIEFSRNQVKICYHVRSEADRPPERFSIVMNPFTVYVATLYDL